MVTDKKRVASYLDDNEVAALDELCKDNTYSRSEAVAHLVRNYLIENDEPCNENPFENVHERRTETIETGLVVIAELARQNAVKEERLQEELAELQEEVSRLKEQIAKNEEEYFTDEQIAAVTHQPEWKVRLWRHGQQKPRGRVIKRKLEPYTVKDGLWKKGGDV